MLAEAGFKVRGVDTSEAAIKLAKKGNAVNVDEDDENAEIKVREQCLDVEFYCADILGMQLTENDFDCVIMNACLEHFDLASAAQLLANLKKHLKPKAYIYGVFDMVATSNKGEFICFDDGTRQYLDPMRKGMYLRNYSDEDLAKLFTEAGFKQLSYTTVDNGSRVVVLERLLHSVQ